MKSEARLRHWHSWWSVALALPVVIVSLTAIFIAHEDALGLKGIPVPAALRLTSHQATPRVPDIRALRAAEDGTLYLATRHGLLLQNGPNLTAAAEFKGIEIRGIASTPDGLVVAGKSGVWMQTSSGWLRLLSGDAWSVTELGGGRIAATLRDRGLLVSADAGATWQPMASVNDVLASNAPKQGFTLHNLIMDLHTGKAFFGKDYEWLWIDIVSGTLLFLTFSGLFMWARSRRQRLKLSLASGAGSPAPAAATQ